MMKALKPTIAGVALVVAYAGYTIIDGAALPEMIEGLGLMIGSITLGLFAVSLPDE